MCNPCREQRWESKRRRTCAHLLCGLQLSAGNGWVYFLDSSLFLLSVKSIMAVQLHCTTLHFSPKLQGFSCNLSIRKAKRKMEENQEKWTLLVLITPQKYLLTTLHTNFHILAVIIPRLVNKRHCILLASHVTANSLVWRVFCVFTSKDYGLGGWGGWFLFFKV